MQNVPASEARDSDYETTFPQDSSSSEHVAAAAVDSQPNIDEFHTTDSHYEEREHAASDEDSDSDDANTTRHRDRFRTERDTSTSSKLSTPANKAEKRDIPDTLGKTHQLQL